MFLRYGWLSGSIFVAPTCSVEKMKYDLFAVRFVQRTRMPIPSISAFTGIYLALKVRPHYYKLLEWKQTLTKWVAMDSDLVTGLILQTHDFPSAQFRLKYNRCQRLCFTSSLCVLHGTIPIPVVYADKKYPKTYYDSPVHIPTLSANPVPTAPLWNLTPPPTASTLPTSSASHTGLRRAPPTVPSAVKVPLFAARLLITDAVTRDEVCPITYNAITLETASVTNCFHIFDTEAIQRSLAMNPICPSCRHATPVITTCV